jgi:hypothetical protein
VLSVESIFVVRLTEFSDSTSRNDPKIGTPDDE